MAKKKASKVSSSPSASFQKSRFSSVSLGDEDDGAIDAPGEMEDGTTPSCLQSPRAASPALTVISTSGSEDNDSIKDFYAEGEGEDADRPLLICKWAGCGEEWLDLQTLIDHVHEYHIGTNKSKYSCEWEGCARRGKPQNSRFSLLSHVRSHTGERPFTCPRPECDKSFTRSDAMAKHMRVQHGTAPNPLRPAQLKKPAGAAGAGGAADGSDGEETGNAGAGEASAETLSSIWECDLDINTESSVGSKTLKSRGHATRSSNRERSESTDLQNPSNPGGGLDLNLGSYPAGPGWVYEEIPDPLHIKIANQEAVDEAELTFWSTKGAEVELARNRIRMSKGATGAGGLPIEPAALFEGISLEDREKMERRKRNTMIETEGGMEAAVRLGLIDPPESGLSVKKENRSNQEYESGSGSDSEIDEESKDSWMRDDRQNAFEIGILSESRKRWASSERELRSKRRRELENSLALEGPEKPTREGSIVDDNPSSNSSTPAPTNSAVSPPPLPETSSTHDPTQPSKRRKVGTSDAASLGLFTNVPVQSSASISSKGSRVPSPSKSPEEDELSLMRRRYLIEKAKLQVVAQERRRLEKELKELEKLRKELRNGPEGSKKLMKDCLTMELGPNVQAIFSPPNSP